MGFPFQRDHGISHYTQKKASNLDDKICSAFASHAFGRAHTMESEGSNIFTRDHTPTIGLGNPIYLLASLQQKTKT